MMTLQRKNIYTVFALFPIIIRTAGLALHCLACGKKCCLKFLQKFTDISITLKTPFRSLTISNLLMP